MREFIRHPADIPVEISIDATATAAHERIQNISHGGLQISSSVPWPTDAIITLRIPCVTPAFQARGKVVWCRAGKQGYDIGVAFLERDALFQLRMIEQICHIEHYKQEVMKSEGRQLDGRQAAMEWIEKHAHDFPRLEDETA